MDYCKTIQLSPDPNRRGDIARMGLKAVAAATLANLMSAAIAGFFLSYSL